MSHSVDISNLYETNLEELEEAKRDIQEAIDYYHKRKSYNETREKEKIEKLKRTIIITEVPEYLTSNEVGKCLRNHLKFIEKMDKFCAIEQIKKIEICGKYKLNKYNADIHIKCKNEKKAKWFKDELSKCIVEINYKGKDIKIPLIGEIYNEDE